MSAPIFEIVAGILGVNLFNLVDIPWIDFIANFGILGLMFFAGLEIDREDLRMNVGKSLVLGFSAYFIPFTSILAVSIIFGFTLKSSALIALSLSTTSLALVYPILKERGMLDEEGNLLLASAMIIDVLSMLTLAAVFIIFDPLTILFLLITLIFMYHAPRISEWFFSRYGGNIVEMEFRFMLLVLLSLAFFSERIGVSEAVLAFVMGMLFSELMEEHDALVEKLRGLVFGFMAPVFFFKTGSLMRFEYLNIFVLALTLLFLLIAFYTKYLSIRLVLPKIGIKDRNLIKLAGLLFNFRLTFGVVAALFGLKENILTQELYGMIITVIITSSIISSTMIKISENREKSGPGGT